MVQQTSPRMMRKLNGCRHIGCGVGDDKSATFSEIGLTLAQRCGSMS